MLQRRAFSRELARITVSLLILLGGIGGFFLLCSLRRSPARVEDDGEQTVVLDGARVKVQTVETEPVRAHRGGIRIQVSGLVVPYRELTVPAEVSGRVESKAAICRAGRYVEQGTELIRIDRRDYELARDEASGARDELRSEIRSTQSLLRIAESQFAVEKRDYQREQKLRDAISEAELDQAERELLASENAMVTLQNQLALLQTREKRLDAALRKAQLDLERTVVRAPVSGVIVRDLVEQDAFVQRGTALLVLEDTSQVEVRCNLRKEDLLWLWVSQPARSTPSGDRPASHYEVPNADASVFFELAGIRYQWEGRLARYEGIGLDSKTRTIPCRVVVPEPRKATCATGGAPPGSCGPPALVRGMYVTVQIQANPPVPLFRVPQRAVRPGKIVWLVRDRKLHKQPVRIVQTLDDAVVIRGERGELSRQDRVVVSPLAYPQNGLPVREASRP